MRTIDIFDIPNYYNEHIYLEPIDVYGRTVDGFDCIHYKDGKILQYPFDKPLKEINLVTKRYKVLDKPK